MPCHVLSWCNAGIYSIETLTAANAPAKVCPAKKNSIKNASMFPLKASVCGGGCGANGPTLLRPPANKTDMRVVWAPTQNRNINSNH